MKKLMFATALVASVAAFADPATLQAMAAPTAINAISFEGYTSGDFTLPYKLVNGAAEQEETGGNKAYNYFCYKGDTDSSTVKAYGSESVTAPDIDIIRPLFFQGATTNDKYLELSTEGGILWRSINAVSGSGSSCTLGEEQEIGSGGLYLDTLVQFTPTEDNTPPTLDTDYDKLAIWLNVDSSATPPVTNLMVRAAVINVEGDPTPTTFTITNKTVSAGEWYRLTVKAIPDIADGDEIPGFQIKLDGDVLMSDTPTLDSDFLAMKADSEYGEDLLNGALFASLLGTDSDPKLQAVGFKGSGALDDIVWTTEDPFAGGTGGDDYKVTIAGSDVVVTPTQADLEAIGQALPGLNVNDPSAVNAALATPIEGSGGIPAWQALFLGLAPTTNALETIKIDSITLENGKVSIEMADGLTLKTGRGVSILFKVFASNDLTTWGDSPIVTATDTTEIPEITPALGETKKFYKVVVDFAETPAQN